MKFIRSVSFFLFFCFYSCKTTSILESQNDKKAPSTIHLQKLVCLNLSEKMAGMGTLNDEVSLIVLSQNEKQELHSTYHIPITKVEKEGEEIPLDYSFDILDQELSSFYFILVEMDTDRKIEAIIPLLIKALSNKKSASNLKDLLAKVVQDDDILGVKEINSNDASILGQNEIKFWGLKLFDEYDYRLKYSVKN